MKKFINMNTIKIEANEITKIKQYCVDNNFNPYDTYVYFQDGIRIGFSGKDSNFIEVNEKNWMPVHQV